MRPLHPSALADWQGCGKRFEFGAILDERPSWRSPLAINGTAVHEAVKEIHEKALWDIPATDLSDLWVEQFGLAILKPRNPLEVSAPIKWDVDQDVDMRSLGIDALEMLDGYRRDKRNREAVILAMEASWMANFGGFDWEGRLDQARQIEGGVEVLDLKTGKGPPTGPPMQLWPQGLTYALALRNAVFRPVDAPPYAPWRPMALDVKKVTWLAMRDYVTYKRNGRRGTKTWRVGEMMVPAFHSIDVDERILSAQAREISLFAQAVRDGRFERRPSSYQCSRCSFREACLRDFTGKDIVLNGADRMEEEDYD